VITRPDGCRPGPTCPCASQASDSGETCAKCARRARWLRRKAHRAYPDTGL
jgi:hypothetical protein